MNLFLIQIYLLKSHTFFQDAKQEQQKMTKKDRGAHPYSRAGAKLCPESGGAC